MVERFTAAGVAERHDLVRARHLHLHFAGPPPTEFLGDFRDYYGPTMNAFEAAEANGRADELCDELEVLFDAQNTATDGATSIPATYLLVTVQL